MVEKWSKKLSVGRSFSQFLIIMQSRNVEASKNLEKLKKNIISSFF